MTDRLTALLNHFELRCRVFFSGAHCGVAAFEAQPGTGHLHLLRGGKLELQMPDGRRQTLTEPTLLFYPYPAEHRLQTAASESADLVCAVVDFGVAEGNPLLSSLPSPLIVPLQALPHQSRLLDLLFEEAYSNHCGQAAAVNRLVEVLLIHLFRYGMQTGVARAGTLAGLADPRLAKALVALHGAPGTDWTLERLAETAGMSRARFAAHFHAVVGVTPGNYLAAWRVSVAQGLMRRGRPLGVVANAVGYSTPGAFSKVFTKRLGTTPRAWLRQQAGQAA
jgi:AraC-like DNA-binding protein